MFFFYSLLVEKNEGNLTLSRENDTLQVNVFFPANIKVSLGVSNGIADITVQLDQDYRERTKGLLGKTPRTIEDSDVTERSSMLSLKIVNQSEGYPLPETLSYWLFVERRSFPEKLICMWLLQTYCSIFPKRKTLKTIKSKRFMY